MLNGFNQFPKLTTILMHILSSIYVERGQFPIAFVLIVLFLGQLHVNYLSVHEEQVAFIVLFFHAIKISDSLLCE